MDDFTAQIILKLLDWPFLFFIGLALFLVAFRKDISKVIARGGISLTWGDNSFEISELPEQLNENFAPVSDDIEELKARLHALEQGQITQPHERPDLDDTQREAAKQKMLNGLSDGQYRWRSIERLASIAGVNKKQAEDILRPLDETVFSVGKSNRTIVRLSSK